jgi:hypothetical protein
MEQILESLLAIQVEVKAGQEKREANQEKLRSFKRI